MEALIAGVGVVPGLLGSRATFTTPMPERGRLLDRADACAIGRIVIMPIRNLMGAFTAVERIFRTQGRSHLLHLAYHSRLWTTNPLLRWSTKLSLRATLSTRIVMGDLTGFPDDGMMGGAAGSPVVGADGVDVDSYSDADAVGDIDPGYASDTFTHVTIQTAV